MSLNTGKALVLVGNTETLAFWAWKEHLRVTSKIFHFTGGCASVFLHLTNYQFDQVLLKLKIKCSNPSVMSRNTAKAAAVSVLVMFAKVHHRVGARQNAHPSSKKAQRRKGS